MMVVDASVMVSVFVPQDANHLPSNNWLTHYITNNMQLVAPMILLPEVAGPVMRRTGNINLAEQIINDIVNSSDILLLDVNQTLAIDAAKLAVALRLRGADAIYVALAQQLNIPLVTWDNEQLSRAAGAIQTFTPATAP